MWARGLKPFEAVLSYDANYVALHVGAWIETAFPRLSSLRRAVALHVGAWIETRNFCSIRYQRKVALHVGAWIETTVRISPLKSLWSRSMWSRGLKLFKDIVDEIAELVALHVGAWIETCKCAFASIWCCRSRSMWARGLKLCCRIHSAKDTLSRSMWARGLKHNNVLYFSTNSVWSRSMWARGLKLIVAVTEDGTPAVALHVGAWIETTTSAVKAHGSVSRAPCGRVD